MVAEVACAQEWLAWGGLMEVVGGWRGRDTFVEVAAVGMLGRCLEQVETGCWGGFGLRWRLGYC